MPNERFPVRRTAECRNCGSTNVFWCKSWKSGRSYLVDVQTEPNGELTACRTDFHINTCTANAAKPPVGVKVDMDKLTISSDTPIPMTPEAMRVVFPSMNQAPAQLQIGDEIIENPDMRSQAVALMQRMYDAPSQPVTPAPLPAPVTGVIKPRVQSPTPSPKRLAQTQRSAAYRCVTPDCSALDWEFTRPFIAGKAPACATCSKGTKFLRIL